MVGQHYSKALRRQELSWKEGESRQAESIANTNTKYQFFVWRWNQHGFAQPRQREITRGTLKGRRWVKTRRCKFLPPTSTSTSHEANTNKVLIWTVQRRKNLAKTFQVLLSSLSFFLQRKSNFLLPRRQTVCLVICCEAFNERSLKLFSWRSSSTKENT